MTQLKVKLLTHITKYVTLYSTTFVLIIFLKNAYFLGYSTVAKHFGHIQSREILDIYIYIKFISYACLACIVWESRIQERRKRKERNVLFVKHIVSIIGFD